MSLESRVVIRLMAEGEMEHVKNAIKRFKDFTNASKRLHKAFDKLERSNRKHKQAVIAADKAHKKYLKILRSEYKKHGDIKKAVKASTKAYNAHQRALKRVAAAQQQLSSSRKGALKELALQAGIKGAKKYVSTGIAAMKKGMDIAFAMSQKLAMGLAAVTVAGSTAFLQLSDSIAKVGLVTSFTSDELNRLKKTAMATAQDSIFSANDIAKAYFDVGAAMEFAGSAGVENLEGIVNTAQTLSIAAGFNDVNSAADLLMTTFRQFGKTEELTTKESERLAGILGIVANETRLSVQDIGVAMQFVGGRAADMDQELENVIAGLGLLRNSGMTASVASTALNQVLGGLRNQSEEAKKWFRRLGVEVVDGDGNFREYTDVLNDLASAMDSFPWRDATQKAEVMNEMFGERGERAVTLFFEDIRSGRNELVRLQDALTNTSDGMSILKDKADDYLNTPMAIMKQMKNTVVNLGTVLGEAFLIDPETGKMNAFVSTLQDFLKSEGVKTFLQQLGLILAKIGNNLMPIIINVFEAFAPLLLELLDVVAALISDEGFQELVSILIEFAGVLGKEVIVLLKSLVPVIKMVIRALIKFKPLLNIIFYAFRILYPVIFAVIKVVGMLLAVLTPFIPVLEMIGKAIALFFIAPLRLLMIIIQGVMNAIGWLVEAFARVTGNKDLLEAAEQMKGFATATDEAMGNMESFYNSQGGIMEDYSFDGINTNKNGETNITTNITIEGDVKDEETVETIVQATTYSQYGGSKSTYRAFTI